MGTALSMPKGTSLSTGGSAGWSGGPKRGETTRDGWRWAITAREVVVHLSFGERSVEGEIQAESPEGRDPLEEGVSATLESIRRQIEEGAGKVEPPQTGAEPDTEENPAVVRDDPPPDASRA